MAPLFVNICEKEKTMVNYTCKCVLDGKTIVSNEGVEEISFWDAMSEIKEELQSEKEAWKDSSKGDKGVKLFTVIRREAKKR